MKTYLDFIKETIDREQKRKEKEVRNENIRTFLFTLGCVLLFFTALHLGFNVCMNSSGDCSKDPNGLLFKPR